jgi:hypothetical protein
MKLWTKFSCLSIAYSEGRQVNEDDDGDRSCRPLVLEVSKQINVDRYRSLKVTGFEG